MIATLLLIASMSVTRQSSAGKVGPMVCDVPAGTTSIKYDVAPGCGGWGSVPVTPGTLCTRVPVVSPQIGQPYYAAAPCIGSACDPYVSEVALSCAGQTANGGCDPRVYHASEPVPASESFSSLHLAPGVLSGDCVWTKDFGGTTSDDAAHAYAVATDASGNVYVTGGFTGSVTFGGTTLTTTTLHNYDIFITKWAPDGTLTWAVKYEGNNLAEGKAIAVDHSGGLVVGGYFWGTIDFGGGVIVSAGFGDAFILKVSTLDGSFVWAKARGSAGSEIANGVAVDSADNVIVTGTFQGTVNFESGSLVSYGGNDAFVTKINSAGTVQWSKHYGGTGADSGLAVGVDSTDIIDLGGAFSGTSNFDGNTLVSAGSTDAYVLSLNADGTVHWVRRFGAVGGESVKALAVSPTRSVAVIGEFAGTVNFGSTTLTNVGGSDAFLTAFDACGTNSWAKQYGTTTSFGVGANAIASDSSGNYVLGMVATDGVDFGTGVLYGSSNDPIVFKTNGTGTTLWAKRSANPYDDYPYGVATDPTGNVYGVGTFWETLDFGCGPVSSPFPTGIDGWLVKFVP